MSSYRKVEIEPWSCDQNDVHIHVPGFSGIHHINGSIVNDTDVNTVIKIGKMTGRLKLMFGSDPHIDWNCHQFCEIANDLLTYTDDEIATARGQLEDLGFEDDSCLENLEIAWLDFSARELWAEAAKEENPWCEKMALRADVISMVSEYMKRRGERTSKP